MERDIFEDIKHLVGCLCISDLSNEKYLKAAKEKLKELDLSKYDKKNIDDFNEYLDYYSS